MGMEHVGYCFYCKPLHLWVLENTWFQINPRSVTEAFNERRPVSKQLMLAEVTLASWRQLANVNEKR